MSERHIHMAGSVVERHVIRGGRSSERDVFEYVLLRVVPRIERGECINAGVLVYCRAKAYVGVRTHLDEDRLRALDPDADAAGVRDALRAVDAGRRFRWLVAPRSTVVQPGPVHTGLTLDPAAEPERLLDLLVR